MPIQTKTKRTEVENNSSQSTSTGAGSVATILAGGYGAKLAYEKGTPVLSRGVQSVTDAAKTFKTKGFKESVKGAYGAFSNKLNSRLSPKSVLPAIYQPTGADALGLKFTGKGYGMALPEGVPNHPSFGRGAYTKKHNLKVYDNLVTKVGPKNIVPGPTGTPQLGSTTARGQNVRYRTLTRQGFLDTPRMHGKINKIEMELAKNVALAEQKYGLKGFDKIDELAGPRIGNPNPAVTHSNTGSKLQTSAEIKTTRLDKAIVGAETKAVTAANNQLDITINKAMGHNRKGVHIAGSATSGNVPINMQSYNPGIAGGHQTTPQSYQGVNPNKPPKGTATKYFYKPGKGSMSTKGIQMLGSKIPFLLPAVAGLAKLSPAGNAMLAADVAGVDYSTIGKAVTADGPLEQGKLIGEALKQSVSTWKNRASSFKSWTKSNMEKDRARKEQMKHDIYGAQIKK